MRARTRRRGRKPSGPERSGAFDGRGRQSGNYTPLSEAGPTQIHAAALDVLEQVGFADAPDFVLETLLEAGCTLSDAGRVLFPRALVEDAIARANSSLLLPGQDPKHDVVLEGTRTYFSTGSASFTVVDPITRTTRPTEMRDIYDFARIVDRLENIHVFFRAGMPPGFSDLPLLDSNILYAALCGTSKHVMANWHSGESAARSLEMLHLVAGGEAAWRARPFVSNTCCFTVSPLKFAPESCDSLRQSVLGGMPVQLVTAAQMGATAPVSAAGVLVQAMAEILGGLVYALALDPQAKLFMGCWQLVSDLRTGAAATGSAEHALLGAAACQMARFYNIPNGVPSGITDSKMPDAQAGAEKALQHALIGNAGGNLLFSSAGTLASGMGISHAGLVIDNDVIGAALRTLGGIPVAEDELAVAQIREVCLSGEGHYLGRQETLGRMTSDFHYPSVFDRSNIKDWVPSGAPSVLDHAVKRADTILAEYHPKHISPDIDAAVRTRFEILVPPQAETVAET